MATQDNIKNLKIFSKKLNDVIDFLTIDNKMSPVMPINSWLDNGWNNYSGSWMDKGWNNYSGSWMDKGWNNYSGSWSDAGWNNYSGSWSDAGWSNSGGGGGCYITTATVEKMGLPDDCDELNLLRMYRDKLAEEDPVFKKIVLEYYKTAPKIVKAISESANKDEILNNIYNDMVSPVIDLLKAGKLEEAKAHYIEKYNELKNQYVLKPQKLLNKKL